jgi:hypothetical protein
MSTLEVKQGDTLRQSLAVTLDGAAVDLTGATLTFTVWNVTSAASALTSTLTITSAAGGLARLSLTPANTASLAVATLYEYEVEQLDATGDVWTPVSGRLIVKPDRG